MSANNVENSEENRYCVKETDAKLIYWLEASDLKGLPHEAWESFGGRELKLFTPACLERAAIKKHGEEGLQLKRRSRDDCIRRQRETEEFEEDTWSEFEEDVWELLEESEEEMRRAEEKKRREKERALKQPNGERKVLDGTKKDKLKEHKRARIAREKLNQSMYEEAKNEANHRRRKRNVVNFIKTLHRKKPRFAEKLEKILEEGGMAMEDFYDEFEEVSLEPFFEIIPVTQDGVTKEIAVTIVGTNATAVGLE